MNIVNNEFDSKQNKKHTFSSAQKSRKIKYLIFNKYNKIRHLKLTTKDEKLIYAFFLDIA
tara:strand:- start:40 stop:219 length:180 start_codon:yes stop_codon:yes gene_type:complete